jgi:hypothetical protein
MSEDIFLLHLFSFEDGGWTFLGKVDKLLPDYTSSHFRRYLRPAFVCLFVRRGQKERDTKFNSVDI